MRGKKYVFWVLSITLVMVGAIAVFVYIADPFFVYHKPWIGKMPIFQNQLYQNNGLIQQFEYDAVLLGTSQTEQFRGSEIDEKLGVQSIKICKSGGHSMDFGLLLNKIIETGKADTIIFGADMSMFQKPSDVTVQEVPEYIYDTNPWNDVSYLLNKEIVFNYSYHMLDAVSKDRYYSDMGDIYVADVSRYSKDITLSGYERAEISEQKPEDTYVDIAMRNVDNIEPYICDNPQIEFYIFIPPYSVLWWDDIIRNGSLEAEMLKQEKIVERFIKYDNVKLFYFMGVEEIITNLDYYKDMAHYNTNVCSKMLDYMKNDQYRMNEENYKEVLEDIYQWAISYDYDSIFMD